MNHHGSTPLPATDSQMQFQDQKRCLETTIQSIITSCLQQNNERLAYIWGENREYQTVFQIVLSTLCTSRWQIDRIVNLVIRIRIVGRNRGLFNSIQNRNVCLLIPLLVFFHYQEPSLVSWFSRIMKGSERIKLTPCLVIPRRAEVP